MYKIFDNFLSKEEYDKINDVMLGAFFPWYCHNGKVNEDDNLIGISHCFYENNKVVSDYYNLLYLIIQKCNMKAVRRVKANLDLKSVNQKSMLHTDFTDDLDGLWTGIYYLNSNNGKTYFENGDEIESVANRMVIFPAKTKHGTITQTDKNKRVVINFNWYGGSTNKEN
tara:strand:- start:480 stop:986 length:507 start_codon:yes stop_codon:yes gene_type:complete